MINKILGFLTNHPTLRNVILGAGMVNIAPKYTENKRKWIAEEVKSRSIIDKTSDEVALEIIFKEFKIGMFCLFGMVVSLVAIAVWLTFIKYSLIMWVITYISAIFLMWILPSIYLEYEINK